MDLITTGSGHQDPAGESPSSEGQGTISADRFRRRAPEIQLSADEHAEVRRILGQLLDL